MSERIKKEEKEKKEKKENPRSFTFTFCAQKPKHPKPKIPCWGFRFGFTAKALRIWLLRRTERLIYPFLCYNKSLIFFRVWFLWWQSETASSFCHRKTKKKTVSSFVRWVRVTAIIRRRSRSRSPRQHPHVGGRGHVLRLLALTSPNCTRYPFFTLCMCEFIIHIFARKIFILYELTVLRNISHCFWPGYWYRYHNQKKKRKKSFH